MRDIKGYEGLYSITSCGKVWSYKSKKFLKPIVEKNGYSRVNLYKEGKLKKFYIHRLVAEAYIENPDNLPQVNHVDGDKSHNWLNNLEYCTGSQNTRHAIDTGLRAKRGKTKRIHDQTTGIIYANCSEAARAVGGNRARVWEVCNKKRKTYKGHIFTFVD